LGMKKNAILYLGVVLIFAIFLLLSIFINRKESKHQEVQSTTTEVIKSDFEDISGDYISSTGEKATVAKNNGAAGANNHLHVTLGSPPPLNQNLIFPLPADTREKYC